MRNLIQLRKLNQRGIMHHIVPIVAIGLLLAVFGGYYLMTRAHAAEPWDGALQLGLDRTLCMDQKPGNDVTVYAQVTINTCTGSASQHWHIQPVGNSGNFQLKSGSSGTCVADQGGAVGVAGHQVLALLHQCNTSDHTTIWTWANAGTAAQNNAYELKNAYSGGCVNDPGNSKNPGQTQIIFSCAANSSNELWYKTIFSASSSVNINTKYSFTTLNNTADPTFNQLLGISNGEIVGYFGSGDAGHPNKGYVITRGPVFAPENYPNSAQTQVTGLNSHGYTVGFYSHSNAADPANNDNLSFFNIGGKFHGADYPTTSPASPAVDQLLGINDSKVMVGFYADAKGNNHGYEYNYSTAKFSTVTDPKAPNASLTAAAINNNNDVAGFYDNPTSGNTDAFLLTKAGTFTDLAAPGAASTSALGVNDHDEVVGFYTVGTGDNEKTHGFLWTKQSGFMTLDDPKGVGTTTINGLDNRGELVGFYDDAAGNTNGFVASPAGVANIFALNTGTSNMSTADQEKADLQVFYNHLSVPEKQQIACSQLKSQQAKMLKGCPMTNTVTPAPAVTASPVPFTGTHT